MKLLINRIKILFATLILVFVNIQQDKMQAQSVRPRLEFTSSGNIRVLADPLLQYQLQKTGNLTPPIAWQSLDRVKNTTESEWVNWSILPIDGNQAYFRVLVTDLELQEGLSLAEAETKVMTEVIKPDELSALVLGLRWSELLSAGVIIQPINQTSANNLTGWRVNEDSYFFVIDHAPSQKLGHPFTWVLVEQRSGKIHTFHSFYPPQIEDLAPFTTLADRWDSAHRFFPILFDGSQPKLADFYQLDFPASAEESELNPQLQEHDRGNLFQARGVRLRSESVAVSLVDCAQITPKMVAVVVASGADDEIQNDAREMGDLLANLGFTVTRFSSATDFLRTVQEGIELATQGLGPCDKFFIYVSSHTQLSDDDNDGVPNRTPSRLDYGLGHETKEVWSISPTHPASVSLTASLQNIYAGRVNIMLDTCFSESMATLIRREKTQPPAGVEWNIFASSAETKTSAGATNLDLLLDYGNDEVNGAYTEIILEEVESARIANVVDTNVDGLLSVEEIEKVFLDAHFAAEDRLAEAQMPKFDRFIGSLPCPVGDIFEIPETVTQTLFVGQNDTLVSGVRYVLVRPPEIHPDLYSWNEEDGTITIIGLSGMTEVDFEYKLVVRSFETPPVTATIKFDPYGAINLTPITSEDDPEKEIYMVPCLLLGNNMFYPVYQFRLVYSPFDECFNPHWHAHTDGNVFAIDVLDRTGIPDNRPFTCGFGKVGEVRFETIPVEIGIFEEFKIDHLPPLSPF